MRHAAPALPALALLLCAALPAQADPVDDPGRLLASNCFQCHGAEGRGARGGFEGIEAREVADELREMARSSRFAGEEGIMRVHAQAYTRDEVALIADYLARACASGCSGGGTGAGAEVAVTVRVPRPGLGDVRADVASLDCTGRCTEVTAPLPSGGSVVLTALPRSGRRFVGWTGGCRGTDQVCELPLDTDIAATAWFARH